MQHRVVSRFGEKYYLNLQDRKVTKTRNEQEAVDSIVKLAVCFLLVSVLQ